MAEFNPDEFLAQAEQNQPTMNVAKAEPQGLSSDSFDPDSFIEELQEEQYGTLPQQAMTAVEGLAQGIAGPLAPIVETKILGIKDEDIRARAETNPITHEVAKGAGLAGSLLTGVGEGAVLAKAGQLAVDAARLAQPVGIVAKVGSEAVRQAAELAILQSSDEISKRVLNDPNVSAESAISNIGLAAALGAGGGAAVAGIVSPLWEATAGKATSKVLNAVKARLDGQGDQSLLNEAKDLGVVLKPEVEAAMSKDPFLRNLSSGLNQTDVTKAGREFQESLLNFRGDVADSMVKTLGKEPTQLTQELSNYETGKELGSILAKEYKAKIDPVISKLEESKARFANTELPKARIESKLDQSNPYRMNMVEDRIPGFVDDIADQISKRALDEGWMTQATSEEARMIRGALKDLGKVNTLGELVKMGQNLGNRTKSVLPFGMQTPLSRAGAIVRDIIRDAENNMIAFSLGKEAPELLEGYRGALQGYKAVANLKDELNSRLKLGPSVGKYAKSLEEMATTDGESLLNRLSGTKDAHLLDFLSQNFPETAQKLREYHVDRLLKSAGETAKGNAEGRAIINSGKLIKDINKMSPELKEFVIPEETLSKLTKLHDMLERLNDPHHNFSNTARTVEKILGGTAPTAMGLVAALTGHGLAGITVAGLLSVYGKEGVDATRLGLLKLLGSNQPIEASALKSTVDFIQQAIKGQNRMIKASEGVFKIGAQVLAQNQLPDERSREKLDKQVEKLTEDPHKVFELANNQTGYYLPNQQVALSDATTKALQYLQTLKPRPYKASPLDKPTEPSKAEIARYNRALDIAQQPNIVFKHIKDGTLQTSDLIDLKTMYPATYNQMAQELTNRIADSENAEQPIPYKTRIGLSLFLGQPMDSTMKPESIMAAQPKPPATPPPAPGKSVKSLGKSNKMYQTPLQQSEQRKSTRD